MEYENMKFGICVQKQLIKLVKLPMLDESQSTYSDHIEALVGKKVNHFVRYILENEDLPHIKELESFRYDNRILINMIFITNIFLDC